MWHSAVLRWIRRSDGGLTEDRGRQHERAGAARSSWGSGIPPSLHPSADTLALSSVIRSATI